MTILWQTKDCLAPWQYVGVRPNGDVSLCCFRNPIANLNDSDLPTILNSAAARSLRASLLSGALDSECKSCYSLPPTTPDALRAKVEDLVAKTAPPPSFDATTYVASNSDVNFEGLDPAQHFMQRGRLEGRPLSDQPEPVETLEYAFDTKRYLASRPDVAAAKVDPVQHFVDFGQFEEPLSGGLRRAKAPTPPLQEEPARLRHAPRRLLEAARRRLKKR